MDPRLNVIDERFKNVKRIIAVSGGKGGVGKSSIAAALALIFSRSGYKVGLLDLDFCGPSAHVILGINNVFPKEENGIIPPRVHGIEFMSIVYYTGDEASPLRGVDISNAMIELLTITRWGRLDFLIIDMPPGIGDATLDVIRLMKKTEFLIVSTRSKTTLETVRKMLKMLKGLKIPILGVIENMKNADSPFMRTELKDFDVPFLGAVKFDKNLEDSIGNADDFFKSGLVRGLGKIVSGKSCFKQRQ